MKFVRTEDGDIVVRPINSITNLRGVLAGKTDEQDRSAVERLREDRSRDVADDAELRRRYVGADDDYDDIPEVPIVRFRDDPV